MSAPSTKYSSRFLVTTEATVARCKVCRRWVLHGLSEGIPTTVDLVPVDETTALAAGLWTYNVWRGQLHYREDWTQRGGGDYGPILADHRH